MSEAKVRVATETVSATAEPAPDYQFLLEENLGLLRVQAKHSEEKLRLTDKIGKLESSLNEAKEQLGKRTSMRAWRRRLAVFHIPLGIAVGCSGLVLWLKGFAPPHACFTGVAGALWVLIASLNIDSLASNER